MPDVIPPDDRRLIDEAVARGRVTVCPPRTCTLEIDKAVPLREQITAAFNAGKARRGRPRSSDKAMAKRAERTKAGVEKVKDRRRFKSTPVPTGAANRIVPADATGTMFPSTVSDPASGLLKDGASNSKIGGDVLVGWLKGAPIFTLTLEERATCPRSCALWRGCYGNSMPFSTRWRHGQALEARLEVEIARLLVLHERILVRLHVLGDFYSLDYVALWGRLLERHPGLHLFGFTAWGPGTPIGKAVAELRELNLLRVWIRHSGSLGAWGAATLDFPTERKTVGDGIVCPEQVSAMNGDGSGRHCGNCAACWSTDKTVFFVEH